jgi:hypothetical protein
MQSDGLKILGSGILMPDPARMSNSAVNDAPRERHPDA